MIAGLGLLLPLTALGAPSSDRLAEWAAEAPDRVLPALQEVTGRTLSEVPSVRFVDRQTFLAEEFARVAPQVAAANPEASQEDVARAAGAYVESLRFVVAAFEADASTLYVIEESLATTLDFAPLPTDEAARAAVECSVAHELTHALQVEHVGPPPAVDAPGALADAAIREGQALWAAASTCRALGSQAGATWHLLVQGALGVRDDPDKDFVYRQGWRQVDRAVEAHGVEAGWALVAAPPSREAIEAATAAEEAAWTAWGGGVERAALPWRREGCRVRRDWRPGELRIHRPPVLSPPEAALADVRWFSWCGLGDGRGVGHAVLADPSRADAVTALLQARFDLPASTPTTVRGERLVVVAVDATPAQTKRVVRKVLE